MSEHATRRGGRGSHTESKPYFVAECAIMVGNVIATEHGTLETPIPGLGLTRSERDNLMVKDTMTRRCVQ